jgi:hypothetical protein
MWLASFKEQEGDRAPDIIAGRRAAKRTAHKLVPFPAPLGVAGRD